jgi:2-iminobutanoate/2-iminopropanoate deaminase
MSDDGRTRIETAEAPAPAGPYSQAIRGNGLIFLAGQGPFTPSGEQPASFEAQVEQTFRNLDAVARAAGSDLRKAVRVGVYLRDMGDFKAMNEVYRRFFSEPYPARTTIQSDIPFSIEVDAVVVAGEG